MKKFFLIQITSLIFGSFIIYFFFDFQRTFDFTLGFMAVLIPNALFAINLSLLYESAWTASTRLILFFLGEGLKVLCIILFLYFFSQLFYPLDWLVFLLGALISLKAIYLIPFVFKEKIKR